MSLSKSNIDLFIFLYFYFMMKLIQKAKGLIFPDCKEHDPDCIREIFNSFHDRLIDHKKNFIQEIDIVRQYQVKSYFCEKPINVSSRSK